MMINTKNTKKEAIADKSVCICDNISISFMFAPLSYNNYSSVSGMSVSTFIGTSLQLF